MTAARFYFGSNYPQPVLIIEVVARYEMSVGHFFVATERLLLLDESAVDRQGHPPKGRCGTTGSSKQESRSFL